MHRDPLPDDVRGRCRARSPLGRTSHRRNECARGGDGAAACCRTGVYTVGCLLPTKASKRLGRFAARTFPASSAGRLNAKLWICAVLLGVLADLPGGVVGDVTVWAVDLLTNLVSPLPEWLFGAA
ncbi:hypothetical protein [Plantactinospora sp. CA-290183]|uniref:hypothetical protein n=1 Tax=Plantactinospora sp. CA-290183 TaxID=3240006 RepID=UPI003D8E5500